MKIQKTIIAILIFLGLTSCALKPVSIIKNESIENYKYVYIEPTQSLTSSSSGVYGNAYGVYGGGVTKTVNPSDLIKGIFQKRGFIIVPEIREELKEEILLVNYGESGQRYIAGGLGGYTIEVTIDLISAKNFQKIGSCTAEGIGSTEADDVRIAITRCLNGLFTNN